MILINKKADYSSCKIGTVNIPIELSELTTTVLSKYSKTISQSKKYALDAFLTKLTTLNVWSRITHLYLPLLAGTPTEAMYDYATDKTNTVASSNGFYEIGTEGIKINSSASTKSSVAIQTGNTANNTLFYAWKTTRKNSGGSVELTGNVVKLKDMYIGYAGITLFANKTLVARSKFSTIEYPIVCINANCSNNEFSSENTNVYVNGEKQDLPTTYDSTAHSFVAPYDSSYIVGYNNTSEVGQTEALLYLDMPTATNAEIVEISSAIDTLVKAFGA